MHYYNIKPSLWIKLYVLMCDSIYFLFYSNAKKSLLDDWHFSNLTFRENDTEPSDIVTYEIETQASA